MQYLVIGLSALTVFGRAIATIAITSIRDVATNRTIDFNSDSSMYRRIFI
jgi:hypothetical protein